ncbi:MAG: hypothetical protein Q7J35_10285 [Candidatus Methanoperedens sp.]|nr:hypothetical protein [Candidatus Methanoperedens sp.]
MRFLAAFLLIMMTIGGVDGSTSWVNNITVNEYGMTWTYNETFSEADSIIYRMNIDSGFGDNDSFVNAWEVLIADKELRKDFRTSIEKELDVRINNETQGIYLVDVDAALSPELVGKTHIFDMIVNKYITTYRFDKSILTAGKIWFMGQPNTPVTIVMPQGVDVVNISGMDNFTINNTDHTEVYGFFKELSRDRAEITLNISQNASFVKKEINATNATNATDATNPTDVLNSTNVNFSSHDEEKESMFEKLSWIRDTTIVAIGLVIILLIYIFKIRKK